MSVVPEGVHGRSRSDGGHDGTTRDGSRPGDGRGWFLETAVGQLPELPACGASMRPGRGQSRGPADRLGRSSVPSCCTPPLGGSPDPGTPLWNGRTDDPRRGGTHVRHRDRFPSGFPVTPSGGVSNDSRSGSRCVVPAGDLFRTEPCLGHLAARDLRSGGPHVSPPIFVVSPAQVSTSPSTRMVYPVAS